LPSIKKNMTLYGFKITSRSHLEFHNPRYTREYKDIEGLTRDVQMKNKKDNDRKKIKKRNDSSSQVNQVYQNKPQISQNSRMSQAQIKQNENYSDTARKIQQNGFNNECLFQQILLQHRLNPTRLQSNNNLLPLDTPVIKIETANSENVSVSSGNTQNSSSYEIQSDLMIDEDVSNENGDDEPSPEIEDATTETNESHKNESKSLNKTESDNSHPVLIKQEATTETVIEQSPVIIHQDQNNKTLPTSIDISTELKFKKESDIISEVNQLRNNDSLKIQSFLTNNQNSQHSVSYPQNITPYLGPNEITISRQLFIHFLESFKSEGRKEGFQEGLVKGFEAGKQEGTIQALNNAAILYTTLK
jgi:hypothetical protein